MKFRVLGMVACNDDKNQSVSDNFFHGLISIDRRVHSIKPGINPWLYVCGTGGIS